MQRGDVIDAAVAIAPDDCPSIVTETKGDDAWIRHGKSSDVYAVVKGVEADWLEIDCVMVKISLSDFVV